MEKNFIRFVINTKDHPRGEKIKAAEVITKVFDDKGKFIEIKRPYIFARENQINADTPGNSIQPFLPLRHWKYENGEIIKKSTAERDKIDADLLKFKEQIQKEIDKKDNDSLIDKNILNDKNKSDEQRLQAAINIINTKLKL